MTAPTPSQTVGPFFGFAVPFDGDANAVEHGVRIEGQVLDGAGESVPDAILEVFAGEQFARCRTDSEGAFHFTVAKTAHLEVFVFARGLLRHLATRMYFPDADLDSDPVLQRVDPERRHTLVASPAEGGLRFDIRLQGEDETVFIQL
ncbi:MAG TPA: protocatechuate 3,4-dioxygenase subunit alpha [Candidatus Dormibacteraeota bacterium]|nr:protocatechuate 3,4-dioxygenase subunit alpha [Candidatus Dormibacteraeota bacterium]